MSLLNAVLQEANKATTEDLKKQRDELVPKIKELTERIQLLTFALQQNFIDLYVNFTPTKSLEQLNFKNRRNKIVSDYSALTTLVESLYGKCGANNEEFTMFCDKLNLDYQLFNNLCIVVEGKNILEKANHEFNRFNYNDAMVAILELQKRLKSLKFEDKLQKALKNLKSQSENQLALYTAQLSTEWEEIFEWTEKKSVFYLTYSLSVQQSDPALIQKVLKTLYSTERLNAELGMFSLFFIDKLLHSVIQHNCEIFTEDHVGAIVFNIKIDLNDPNKPNYQTIFNNLTAIFEFLESTLGSQFECDRKFMEVFADSIRDKFFHKIINDCIKNNLPFCDASYENYKIIAAELDCFNKFLIDLRFVEADKSPLNKYVNDSEGILYGKKCSKLLSDVRDLLSQSLQQGPLEAGTSLDIENESTLDVSNKAILWDVNKPLFLPKCIISQNVKKIMTLIVEHLEESTKLPDTYRKKIVVTIKNIAIMYQTVVPLKFETCLDTSPLDVAIFFNNCFYLAHGLLGPPWRNTLPFSQADLMATMLVGCIQDLRVLGLQKISVYLKNKKSIITEAFENKVVNSTIWTQENYDQFDSAVNDAVNLIKEHKDVWRNVLPTRMYLKSVCALIYSFCQSVLLSLLNDSRPISEELVYMLAVRLQDAVKEIECIFDEPTQLETNIDVWTKFAILPHLLKAQLLELAELWREDKKLSKSFSCDEVRHIIKIRFQDNKFRLKILKEIQ